jgi:hypothetical protein
MKAGPFKKIYSHDSTYWAHSILKYTECPNTDPDPTPNPIIPVHPHLTPLLRGAGAVLTSGVQYSTSELSDP